MCNIFIWLKILTTTRNIITELNKGEKLNDNNYHIWHCKFWCILEDQKVLETLNHVIQEPKQRNFAQHRAVHKAYMVWKRKFFLACTMLLSCMDDISIEYELYHILDYPWNVRSFETKVWWTFSYTTKRTYNKSWKL